jgi:hypothetical protein
MIAGTDYSPQKAFVAFAREFFEHVANDNWGQALAGLNQSAKRWSKVELQSELRAALSGESVISPLLLTQSASPELIELEPDTFALNHRVPTQRGWASTQLAFRFVRKPGTGYFHAYLEGLLP